MQAVGAMIMFHCLYYRGTSDLLCQLLPKLLQLDLQLGHSVRSHEIPRSNRDCSTRDPLFHISPFLVCTT